jgi:hypothetical protein
MLGLGAVALTTTAGACQQDHEGELPSPEEMEARPFPAGTIAGDLDAIYARLTAKEQDGTECFDLIRLTPQGEAQFSEGCSTGGVEEVAADERVWSAREYVGDYAHAEGRIWFRIVSWRFPEDELALAEFELISCDTELHSPEEPPANMTVHPYTLVSGAVPPDTPRCDP